ncbi:MAG: DNA-binding protein [Myxococcales bacterium]|nr:DNA-binding protein [Myxococcales bacterium]
MAQRKILLDSNSYLRLAQTIHPLLQVEFGEECHCLYAIRELQQEFDRSSRLQTKFHWVNDPQYAKNRSRSITVTRKQAKTITLTISVIKGEARQRGLDTSPVDASALATASVLEVPLVTDDGDMLTLADIFDIKAMKTLELLRLMLDCNHATMQQVIAAAGYWRYAQDLPKDYEADFRRLFRKRPP